MADKKSEIATAIKNLNKKYGNDGDNVISRMKDTGKMEVEAIPTNCISLDYVFGCGGLPRGRMIEVFGPESCLSEETFISYEVRDKKGKRQNNKGGTIKRLHERFNGLNVGGQGKYQRKQTVASNFYVSSINEDNFIVKNKVNDVVHCGKKECFKVITEGGKSIICSNDHKFYVGSNCYLPLSDLSIGSTVYVHNNTTFKGRKPQTRYKEILVKYHPTGSIKVVNGCSYHRIKRSHAVFEANLNDFSLEEYIIYLNKGKKEEINKLKIISRGVHLHHINFDPSDDRVENLQQLPGKEHNRLHALNNGDKLNFLVTEDIIKSIEKIGKIDTYDIKCQFPYNNYVANGIVVHNSGKSTLAMFIVGQIQKNGGNAVWIDVEFAFSREYARDVGVDVDNLIISQPTTGEEALDIVDKMVKTNEVDIIVLDSVAALVPAKELEGELTDVNVAQQARMMSKAMRLLAGNVSKTKTAVIFINQERDKIGVFFGKKTTTPGGKALKFFSSVRLEIHKGANIVNSIKDVIGNIIKICAVKNKVGLPFRKTEIELYYKKGIDLNGDLLNVAVQHNVITQAGGTYKYKRKAGDHLGETLANGKEKLKQLFVEDKDLAREIKTKVLKKIAGV